MAKDPYSTLNVARTATEADIKKAYRKLAKELHPDRNSDNPKAADRFAEVTRAYDILSDKDKRAQFDRGEIDGNGDPAMPFGFGGGGSGFNPGGGPGGGFSGDASFGGADLGDLFEGLFGGRARGPGGPGGGDPFAQARRAAPPQKGANRAYRLAVSFIDAATLAPQRITLSDGKTIDLKLPKGVDSDTQMRLTGKGEPGPAGPGDAIVTIDVRPHAFFTRDGDHVRLSVPVALNEAVQGAKIKVPTVDGPVMLGIPAGSSSGRTLRLKGKGFTGKDGTRGDQLVTITVDLPEQDAALQQFVAQWQDNRSIRRHLGV